MRNETRGFILKVIQESTGLDQPEQVDDNTPLGDEGLELESLSTLELSLRLEEAYGIQVPVTALDPNAIATLGQFLDIVVDLRTGAAAVGGAR